MSDVSMAIWNCHGDDGDTPMSRMRGEDMIILAEIGPQDADLLAYGLAGGVACLLGIF